MTASCEGALVVLVAVQLSVLGLYLPPVLDGRSAPDDHFTAGPHCRVRSGQGCVGECRWSPRVIGAATRGASYYRKM